MSRFFCYCFYSIKRFYDIFIIKKLFYNVIISSSLRLLLKVWFWCRCQKILEKCYLQENTCTRVSFLIKWILQNFSNTFFTPLGDSFSSVHHFVYVFPIFFCFHKSLSIFHLRKNLPTDRFFRWNLFFDIFTMAQGSCRFLFEVK